MNATHILQRLPDETLGDLPVGLRGLARRTALCALAVTVLTLGTGGVTPMFSVTVTLRSFSFANALCDRSPVW